MGGAKQVGMGLTGVVWGIGTTGGTLEGLIRSGYTHRWATLTSRCGDGAYGGREDNVSGEDKGGG